MNGYRPKKLCSMFNLKRITSMAIGMVIDERAKLFNVLAQPFEKRGLQVRRFRMGKSKHHDFIDNPDVPQTVNYFDAVKTAMRWALGNNIDSVLFLEDDAIIGHNFDEVMNKAIWQLDKNNWQMLYLGANRLNALVHPYGPHLLEVRNALGFFGVVVTKEPMEAIIKLRSSPYNGIDGIIGTEIHHKFRTYSIYPNVVHQMPGLLSCADKTKRGPNEWAHFIGDTIKQIPLSH